MPDCIETMFSWYFLFIFECKPRLFCSTNYFIWVWGYYWQYCCIMGLTSSLRWTSSVYSTSSFYYIIESYLKTLCIYSRSVIVISDSALPEFLSTIPFFYSFSSNFECFRYIFIKFLSSFFVLFRFLVYNLLVSNSLATDVSCLNWLSVIDWLMRDVRQFAIFDIEPCAIFSSFLSLLSFYSFLSSLCDSWSFNSSKGTILQKPNSFVFCLSNDCFCYYI